MVYLDLLMGLNFLVDFLLLLSVQQLTGFPLQWKKITLAALFGGIYSGMCLLPGVQFLGNGLWRLVSLAIMTMIAFGINATAIQRGAVFSLLSMALGGAAMGIRQNHLFGLLLCGFVIWLLCRLSFRGNMGQQEYVAVELRYGDREIRTQALRDTGNLLQDPVTGERVLVAGVQLGAELLGITEKELRNPVELVISGKIPGMRLIPYHSVGQAGGMLPMLRIHHVKIGSTYSDALVAFAAERIGNESCYQMLTGGAI